VKGFQHLKTEVWQHYGEVVNFYKTIVADSKVSGEQLWLILAIEFKNEINIYKPKSCIQHIIPLLIN